MNESEDNFESLRRLLALKRHEIPPPGYFNNFSDRVVARIRAGETAGSWEKAGSFWLLNFFRIFETKPAFAGAFASSLCMLLLFGVIYTERPDSTPKTSLLATMQAPAISLAANTTTPAAAPDLSASSQPMGLMISTNPVLSLAPIASFFGQPNPLAQPVSTGLLLPGN